MTKTELKMAAEMLNMAAEEFSNHGCNEFYIKNTPENLKFILGLDKWYGDEEYTPTGHEEKICMIDTQIMRYCAFLLENESKQK